MSSATKVGYCPQLGIFDYIGNFRQPQINLLIFLLLFCWKMSSFKPIIVPQLTFVIQDDKLLIYSLQIRTKRSPEKTGRNWTFISETLLKNKFCGYF